MKIWKSSKKNIILGILICFNFTLADSITRDYWDDDTHLWNVTCSNGTKISIAKTNNTMYTVYNITEKGTGDNASSLNEAMSKECNSSNSKITVLRGAYIFTTKKDMIEALLDDSFWGLKTMMASKLNADVKVKPTKYYHKPKIYKGIVNGQTLYEFDISKKVDTKAYKLVPLLDSYYEIIDGSGKVYFRKSETR